MRISRSVGIGAGIGAAALALALYAMRPAALTVDVAPVTHAPLRVTVDQEGRTRVRDRYIVASPVAGRLMRLALREGDDVQAGQVVAFVAPLPLDSLTDRQADARLAAAEALAHEADARVAVARTTVAQAQHTVERRRSLAGAAVSTEEYDVAMREADTRRRELDAAESRARAARADVDAARAALAAVDGGRSASVPVHAPVSGSVLRVPEQSERVLPAGTPILELGDPRSIELVIDVLSSDAVRIHPGDSVEIDEWGGDSVLWGRVRLIERSAFTKISALGVDEQRVNVRVDIERPPATVGDNFRVQARIVIWHAPDVLTVPSSALVQTRTGAWSVFVLDHGRARLRAVDVGHRSAAATEILSGLTAGTAVILFPSDQVSDGVRVRARKAT